MLYCNQCGRQNAEDAKFCDGCGSQIIIGKKAEKVQAPPPATTEPARPAPAVYGERFGTEMRAAGERFGRRMAEAGERLGKEFEGMGKRLERKYDEGFRALGPLVGAVIGWGILVFVTLGVQAARSPSGDPSLHNLGIYMAGNLLLFLGILLLFGYVNYALRKMRAQAKWVLPVAVAAGITVFCWVAADALAALATDTGNSGIADASSIGKALLPVIFIVIVVVGYIMVLMSSRMTWGGTAIPPWQRR